MLPTTIGPSACIPNDPYYDCVSPDRIFYANGTTNTSGQGVNYVSSNGITYATANNMDDDEIVAVFDIQNDCDLLALSGMRVLVDLEPVCNTSTQTYCNPSNASVFLDAGQLEMSVYFSPDVSCDADIVTW